MNLDPAVREFVERSQKPPPQPETQATRETKLRPHETARKTRMVTITFPNQAWPNALRAMSKRWNLRLGDLLVWCVSYAIAAILRGEVERPDGEGRQQHHKAAEWLDLPWEPK